MNFWCFFRTCFTKWATGRPHFQLSSLSVNSWKDIAFTQMKTWCQIADLMPFDPSITRTTVLQNMSEMDWKKKQNLNYKDSFMDKWGGKKKEALIKVYICVCEFDGNDICQSRLQEISPTAYRELSSDFQEAGGFSLMILRPDDDDVLQNKCRNGSFSIIKIESIHDFFSCFFFFLFKCHFT